jgi:hypothetical protein
MLMLRGSFIDGFPVAYSLDAVFTDIEFVDRLSVVAASASRVAVSRIGGDGGKYSVAEVANSGGAHRVCCVLSGSSFSMGGRSVSSRMMVVMVTLPSVVSLVMTGLPISVSSVRIRGRQTLWCSWDRRAL